MSDCEQSPGHSVLDHGLAVHTYFNDLHQHIILGQPLTYDWRLPEWVSEKALWVDLLASETIKLYQIYHDCGKPFCRSIDAQGRAHFAGHASLSKATWLRYAPDQTVIAELIGMDMDIHLLKADDCLEFFSRKEAATLLLTGLSEIHANAALFGGIDSVSFKIKWKQINKRGKRWSIKVDAQN